MFASHNVEFKNVPGAPPDLVLLNEDGEVLEVMPRISLFLFCLCTSMCVCADACACVHVCVCVYTFACHVFCMHMDLFLYSPPPPPPHALCVYLSFLLPPLSLKHQEISVRNVQNTFPYFNSVFAYLCLRNARL